MLKMAILLAPLFLLCVSVAGQEMLQILSLNNQDSHTLGVSVDQEKVNEVSTSILMAEKWLKTHVLSHYPSINITSIVVSNNLLCDENEKDSKKNVSSLVLFAMNNIYHSLIRWGLEKNIKVSIFLTPKCLQKPYLENIFIFLKNINSTYTIKNVQKTNPTRKLSFTVRSSEISYSIPSDAASAPLPPLIGVISPSPPPETQPPMVNAAPPHYGLSLPPCNPYHNSHHGGATAAAPVVGNAGGIAAPPLGREKLWCVAKPSVPAEQLQEAMDYACGDGGVDCGPISPTGNCYFPATIVSHASYAFNSYWQKNKKKGGTCSFGGTAMLISSDPSFLHCHFIVA
uniref:glucan endo-1,3-beta-glucosidase 13-like n=1 Tax=Erigeron canadensis TaxID=72917 RepID=UPI001CB9C6F2|nr:glucan endo-1,3-beta-glucosidase 13-like [Erigeron canadensis]